MKKFLLSATALMMYATSLFAQDSFTQAVNNTGFNYDCDLGIGQSALSWAVWGPACTGSDNGGGGLDEAPVNEFGVQWGQSGKGQIWIILSLTTPLNLSDIANQKIKVNLRNINPNNNTGVPITYNLKLEDAANNSLITPIEMNVTGTSTAFELNLSNNIASGKNLSSVKKIIFQYDGCTHNTIYDPTKLLFSDFKVGSYVVNSIEDDLLKNISSNSLYPNPTKTNSTVILTLHQVADIKITLNNTLGTQIQTLVDEKSNSINKTFNTSDLASGVYFVSYLIDGIPVKTEKLIIE